MNFSLYYKYFPSLLTIFFNLLNINETFQTNGKKINVCRIKNGGTCSASSVLANLRDYTYKCENALEPQWINHRDWASDCLEENTCSLAYLLINFKQKYDIAEICIEQRLALVSFLTRKVRIEYSNGRNTTHTLDSNQYQKCYLLPGETGKQNNWIKVLTLEGYGTTKRGLGSVIVYAFNGDDTNSNDEIHYTNIAEFSSCSAPYSGNMNCQRALNYDSNENLLGGWITSCARGNCFGLTYELTFPFTVQPKITCVAGREFGSYTIPLEIKAKWSSNFIQFFTFSFSRLRQCFEYTKDFFETGVTLNITKYHEPARADNVGLAYVNVYIIDTPQKFFFIESTDEVIYHFSTQFLSPMQLFSFGVKVKGNGNCHSFIINLMNKDGESKVKITLDVESITVLINGTLSHIGNQTNNDHLLLCNTWKDFWISLIGNDLQIGKGQVYNNNLLYSTKVAKDKGYVTKLEVNNGETSTVSIFRVNSYNKNYGLKINAIYPLGCSTPLLENLHDFNTSTCFLVKESPYIFEAIRNDGNSFGILKNLIKITLKFISSDDKKSIAIYLSLAEIGKQVSNSCPLSSMDQLNEENLWEYEFDCGYNKAIIERIVIIITADFISNSLVELCEVNFL
ncbi:DgyrCDS14933 [Dimorphilus gyrociliatus]|uniref:DgyrCDS14933 n=1 Tax=Dimorphilus gyrociliatus TaxID=2664684 RepID=A0A7I8WFD6_9ANNE|nr:DgyrCDS14933 [Dimorphilus gyrociliatus]